ncbi:hypothetical protein [Streptomyces pseudovenezuelae]|uniref:hypothetical protein n=1 Tax=Streptomyces pseudovenezuelae TaxID=67350 RepID=UPI00371C4841
MTPWLRATVLAILVGTSATAVPQADLAYGAELTPRVPPGQATHPVSLQGTRSPESAPAHRTPGRAPRPDATGLPSHPAPGASASPSGIPSVPTPAHGPRHPAPGYAAPSGPPRGHGPERASPSPSLAPSPSAAAPSRAGSRAGEGRERPGRREEPVTQEAQADGTDPGGTDSGDDDLTAVSEPPPRTAVARPSRPAERPVASPKVFILPLGTGLVLVGLGLGLGLYALRVRRG